MLVTLDNLGEWGVLRDGLPHELPDNAWSDGRNVRFREGYAEKFTGEVEAYGASTIDPYHVCPLVSGTSRLWIEAGLNQIYSVNSSAVHTNITRASGGNYSATADRGWTSTVLGGIAILNNGIDVPQAWGGTGLCVDLANWPSTLRARSIRAFRNFLIAMNVTKSGTNFPHMLKWSHGADPGTVPASWDETDATRDAGEGDLSDTPTHLVDGLVLGDMFIAYKEGSYYALEDVGGYQVLRARLVSPDMGMLTQNCAAAFPNGHCVLGQNDVYVHSGGPPETILTARARRWLFSQMDSQNYRRAFVVGNPLSTEVWVCFPSIGSDTCDLALVWNWKANSLAIRELADVKHGATGVVDADLANSWETLTETWETDSGPWNQSAVSDAATRLVMAGQSELLMADSGAAFGGSAPTAYVERTGLSLGQPQRVKLLRGVRPIIEGATGSIINVRIGAAMTPNATPTWSTAVPFNIGTDIQVDSFAKGRYLAIRFESNTSINWRMKRLDLDVELAGGY